MRALKKIFKDISKNRISVENLDEDMFAKYLDTEPTDFPDLIIRTSLERQGFLTFFFGNQPTANYILLTRHGQILARKNWLRL